MNVSACALRRHLCDDCKEQLRLAGKRRRVFLRRAAQRAAHTEVHDVIREACWLLGLSSNQLMTGRQDAKYSEARAIIACCMRRSGMTLHEAGQALEVHHTTVICAVRRAERWMREGRVVELRDGRSATVDAIVDDAFARVFGAESDSGSGIKTGITHA